MCAQEIVQLNDIKVNSYDIKICILFSGSPVHKNAKVCIQYVDMWMSQECIILVHITALMIALYCFSGRFMHQRYVCKTPHMNR